LGNRLDRTAGSFYPGQRFSHLTRDRDQSRIGK
jgi:hypothetical protein